MIQRIVDAKPIVRYVTMRVGATRMVLETWVGRSVRLADYGPADGVDRGLLIRWEFFDPSLPAPAPSAKTAA